MLRPDPTFFEIRIRWSRQFSHIDLPGFQEGPGGGDDKGEQTDIMKIYLGPILKKSNHDLQGFHLKLYIFLGIRQFLRGVIYLCTSRGKYRSRGRFDLVVLFLILVLLVLLVLSVLFVFLLLLVLSVLLVMMFLLMF